MVCVGGRDCVLAGQRDTATRYIQGLDRSWNSRLRLSCNLQKLIHCKFYEFVKINVGEILGLADGLSVGAKVLTFCSA